MEVCLFHGNSLESNRILYTPSAFAKNYLIHLQEIGELKAQKPHTSMRENLGSYLFFMVLEGSGTLEYEGREFQLSVGDCVFIDCRKSYAHTTTDDLWRLKWIHFYGMNMNNIYDKYSERGGQPCFHTDKLEAFKRVWSEIYDCADSSDYIRDMRIFEKLTSLLTLLMDESWHPGIKDSESVKIQNLQNIKEYIDIHYNEKITLDSLAEKFFINKFYLTRIFKNQFGVSINSYISQIRITHAKRLLRFTDKTIEEIASECGINDANYFSRMFKKIEGVSPHEFRKAW